jgi:hypothetical protein
VTNAKFLLEHFYYGQTVANGKPQGEPRVLAKSAGLNEQMIKHAVDRVNLPPLIRSDNGAWALTRGRSRQMPFLMAQAQQGDAGQVIEHYIVLQTDALKAQGGDIKTLRRLVQDELPIFEAEQDDPLPPIEMEQSKVLAVDEHIDDILELMTVTKNRPQLIEPLLAAIVEGVQVVVQGAPPNLEERTTFIAGLLALLPPSARFGVTFATHSLPSTDIDVQIRFYSDDFAPEGTTIFNWAHKTVTGEELKNDYARFIISQLRLDAELVIQSNMAMAEIAGWRLNEGDKLSDALDYASKRQRVDAALLNNQPANKDEVSRILEEDPTLPDELRALYAGHLIRFSLAMEDMQYADPVALLLRDDPDLEQAVLRQMDDAVVEGQSWLIYETLVKWMSNPLGPEGVAWVKLTHRAALTYLEELVDDNAADEINEWLQHLQSAGSGVAIGQMSDQIVRRVTPVASQDAILNENRPPQRRLGLGETLWWRPTRGC